LPGHLDRKHAAVGKFPLKLVLGAAWLGGEWCQCDGVAEVLEAMNVMAFDASGVELIQVVDAEFGVRLLGAEDVVSHDE
jgi:hypothetical protein